MATTTHRSSDTPPRDDEGKFKAKSTRSRANSNGAPSTTAIIGAAAAGLAVGLVANLGRKFAVQAPTAFAGDWFDALKAEHKAAIAIFDALEKTDSTQTTKRTMLLAQLKHALGKHAFQEENAVYPMLRERGQTGDADELNGEHGYVKQYLHDLSMLPKDSAMFLSKLAEFRSDLEDHVREEEDRIFPALRASLSTEENKALTTAMNKEGFKLA